MIETHTCSDVILDAAKEVFETMIFMEIEPSQDEAAMKDPGVIGTITYKGSLEGGLAFSTSMDCAEVIARNMLAIEADNPISREEICDAVGEVVSMVMGSVKTRLQETYPAIEVSIPSVITGNQLDNLQGEGTQKRQVRICLDVAHEAQILMYFRKTL